MKVVDVADGAQAGRCVSGGSDSQPEAHVCSVLLVM